MMKHLSIKRQSSRNLPSNSPSAAIPQVKIPFETCLNQVQTHLVAGHAVFEWIITLIQAVPSRMRYKSLLCWLALSLVTKLPAIWAGIKSQCWGLWHCLLSGRWQLWSGWWWGPSGFLFLWQKNKSHKGGGRQAQNAEGRAGAPRFVSEGPSPADAARPPPLAQEGLGWAVLSALASLWAGLLRLCWLC